MENISLAAQAHILCFSGKFSAACTSSRPQLLISSMKRDTNHASNVSSCKSSNFDRIVKNPTILILQPDTRENKAQFVAQITEGDWRTSNLAAKSGREGHGKIEFSEACEFRRGGRRGYLKNSAEENEGFDENWRERKMSTLTVPRTEKPNPRQMILEGKLTWFNRSKEKKLPTWRRGMVSEGSYLWTRATRRWQEPGETEQSSADGFL